MRRYLLRVLVIGGMAGIVGLPVECCRWLLRHRSGEPLSVPGASALR